MFKAITKTTLAAALTVSTLAGGASTATTGAAITTVAAVSVIASTPAEARSCQNITGKGFANAVFNRAGQRRAARRANRDVKSQAASRLGRNFTVVRDVYQSCRNVKGQRGQSGFQTCTVIKFVCGS